MTQGDVIASLQAAGLYHGAWTLDDMQYDPVSSSFINQAWMTWVASLPPELKHYASINGTISMFCPMWIAEVYDCDNIAIDFAVYVDRCMAIDAVKNGKKRGNAAIGRFNFLLNCNKDTAHCRNWFIDHDGRAHVFDAGNCALDTQTPEESATCFCGESI